MARAVKTIDVSPQQPVTETEIIDAEDSEAEATLNSVLTTLGESQETARVMLYRSGKNGEKDSFLKQFSPVEWLSYDLAGVLNDYGGGDFRVRIYNAQTKLIKNVPIRIEEPRGGIKKPETVLPPANSPDILHAIGQMTANLTQAMLTGFQALAKELAPKPETRSDMLREMQMMKEIIAPDRATQQPQSNPMEVFLKGVEFARQIIPPSKDGETTGNDVFLELIRQFGPALGQAAAKVAESAVPAVPRVPVSPEPMRQISTEPAKPAAPVIPAEESELNFRMKLATEFLIQQAAANNPVETYAEMAVDNLDETMLAQIDSQDAPAIIEYLAQFNPGVRQHADWFTRLHTALKELLTEEPQPGTSTFEPGASTDS